MLCLLISYGLGSLLIMAEARFVYTPSARNFDELGRFIKYTDSTVRSMMGFNSGYSRWLDDHWGIQLSSSTTLDTFRKVLERALDESRAHSRRTGALPVCIDEKACYHRTIEGDDRRLCHTDSVCGRHTLPDTW